LLRYITGARAGFESSGKHRRSTVFVGGTDMRQPSLIPEPKRRLAIGLSGNARENPPQPRWGRKPTPFATLVLSIYRAADDRSIGEMALYLKDTRLGFAQTQELREAITYFRSLDKRVYCHLARPGNLGYYLASAADKILIPPVSRLNLIGLRAELSFYAGTMEKLGVRADVMRIGEHKTAAEMLTRRIASEENRAQINRLLDSLYDQFVAAIASGRGVSTDSVRRVIDGGPYTSVEAMQLGLVDGLSYRDDMNDDFLETMPEVSFRRYLADTLVNDNWPAKPVIAMVVADGEITTDDFAGMPFNRSQQATPAPLKKAFRRVMNDRNVKGIVLRVNSPGGLALAADEIFHAADKASEKRLLVVSMGNVAASGGYQVSMAADQLFASPATITGSIGIFGGKVDLSELYRKIDLGKELFVRGKYAGMMTTTRPFSEEQRVKYFSHMKAFYDYFVGLVAENRALAFDSVDAMARGKVWTGNEALANGLIDRQGGIKQSLDYLADHLGLDDYAVEISPRKRPLFILPGQSYLAGLVSLFSGDGSAVEKVAAAVGLPDDEGMFARMPFDIAIE
ncbi:MAG: signal peptide peptidase SppA, partial [candidate division Zixibacteria bacterium]|nr:signal peptide peptidase SppA [candidate division Zixibacteria bacterium]